ncbi:MAG: hypothetical protein ACI3VB_04590 [Oscillospiraceae bacterium]
MKQKLRNFFMGRNGMDSIAKLTLWISMLFLIASMFTTKVLEGALSSALWAAGLVLIIYTYWRMFSKNIYKRSAENDRYIAATGGIRAFFRNLRVRISQRKNYRFFKCPSCHAMLRVPRGKGKIQITCKKCGNRFSGKT